MNKIKSAYKALGKTDFYDGMMTCTTFSGKLVSRLVWGMGEAENNEYVSKAMSGIPKDFSGRLLEVPVGTGVLSMPLYKTLPNADITCLDYSPEMMSRAETRAANMRIKNVNFVQGDVGNLQFWDNSFDIVLSMNGFQVFPDKEAAYSETYRVLKKGGIFCGCFYIKGELRRSDWFIGHPYAARGFCSPPFETRDSLENRLKSMYETVEIETVKSIACFRCVK